MKKNICENRSIEVTRLHHSIQTAFNKTIIFMYSQTYFPY